MLLLVGMFHVIDQETVCQFYYHHFQAVDKQSLFPVLLSCYIQNVVELVMLLP